MYDPATREAKVVLKGLYYANGVALSKEGDYVMVVETNRIRVHRHWLKGPKAGATEVVIENLPGAPDGIARASDGNFWVALLSPVPPIAKLLGEPAVRAIYAWLPDALRPKLKPWGAVAKVCELRRGLLGGLVGCVMCARAAVAQVQGPVRLATTCPSACFPFASLRKMQTHTS